MLRSSYVVSVLPRFFFSTDSVVVIALMDEILLFQSTQKVQQFGWRDAVLCSYVSNTMHVVYYLFLCAANFF